MPSHTSGDSQQHFVLGLLAVLVLLVTGVTIGAVVYQHSVRQQPRYPTVRLLAVPPMPTELPALAPAAVIVNEQPVVRVDGHVVKFFFATDKADVAKDAAAALGFIVAGARIGQRVRVVGYHHGSGASAGKQISLTQARMQAVRAVLLAQGVRTELIDIAPPIATPAGAGNAQARRVEVRLESTATH